MTIAVDVDSVQRQQVIKQMNKLIKCLAGHRPDRFAGGGARAGAGAHPNAAGIAHGGVERGRDFRRRVVDSSTEGFAIEATGDPEKLGEFIDVMSSYGEIEVTRSGALAIGLETKKLRLQPPVANQAGSRMDETVD